MASVPSIHHSGIETNHAQYFLFINMCKSQDFIATYRKLSSLRTGTLVTPSYLRRNREDLNLFPNSSGQKIREFLLVMIKAFVRILMISQE